MKRTEAVPLDFVIDRLTNSVQNTISGDSFETEIHRLRIQDLKGITRINGWNFDWKSELKDDSREVFKLTIVNNSDIIQGLLSLTVEKDHVLMNLLESAPFNIGKKKLYEGVAANLVAYSCKISYQQGFDGYVAFTSKTKLIKHYEETLGAVPIGGQRMVISANTAKLLVERYFKT